MPAEQWAAALRLGTTSQPIWCDDGGMQEGGLAALLRLVPGQCWVE
jgi:hypothetical protein